MREIKNIDEIVHKIMGLHFGALFSGMAIGNPGLSFDEKRECFFNVTHKLLADKRIMFTHPDADCSSWPGHTPKYTISDYEAQWHAPPEEIVAYLREHWPSHVKEESEWDLQEYFYSMPGLIWVADDGTLVSS